MQRAHEVLYYVGLGEARYRNIETYSTGMKQRIKLAQALVHDPDLLFLDEPTNGMDPKGRDEMLELIRDLGHNKNVNLILSSHLLPDVEFTCDHVIVMDKGQVVAQGPIEELKGPAGRVFELRIKGDLPAFLDVLRARRHGMPFDRRRRHARVRARRAATSARSSQLATRARRAGPPPPAERPDARGRLRQSRRGRVTMPIHDQSYRRYGGGKAALGRSWTVIAKAGIMTHDPQARVHRPAAVCLVAVRRPRGADLRRRELPAGRGACSRRTRRCSAQFLEQQDFFVFVMTIYVGAGLIANDRRANALQIYLSKPLLRSEYIAGKAAVLFTFLMLVTWLPAILLLFLQVMFKGSFEFLRANLFLFPAITVGVAAAGAARDLHDAGAVVAVEEQPLRRHPLRRHHLLHRGDLRRDASDHRQHAACRGCRSAPT